MKLDDKKKGYLPLILGSITLLLFATKPYILDLIEPAKSIGQIIGENAKDLIDSLNSETKNNNSSSSKRAIWSNIITILAFIFFALSLITSTNAINKNLYKFFGIIGAILAIIGFVIYISHLAIGLIGFIVIAVLVVAVVAFEGL